jgi:outer membrane lipoprotein SlyB
MPRLAPLLVLTAALAAAGCVPVPVRPIDSYPPGAAMRVQTVETGFVESLRDVRIGGMRTGVGGTTGAVTGSIAGSFVGGSWQANVAGSIVGAILGGLLGSAIEESATARPGVEVGVRLDNGGYVVVVQDAALEALRQGDRVRLLSDGIAARVTR